MVFRPKQSHNYPKVPTCNLYGPGSKEILEWGYPAKIAMAKPPYKNHTLLSKYKLHLDEASGPHPPLPNGLTVVDAIADYLRLFHAHVVQVSACPVYFSFLPLQHYHKHGLLCPLYSALGCCVSMSSPFFFLFFFSGCSQRIWISFLAAAHPILPFCTGHVERPSQGHDATGSTAGRHDFATGSPSPAAADIRA